MVARILLRRLLPLSIALSVSPSFATRVVLTSYGGSWPYNASSNDTIVVDDDDGTVTVFEQSGKIIRINGSVSGVRVLLNNDTLVFDTDSSSTGSNAESGIQIDTIGGGRPSDILIYRGGIRSTEVSGHGLAQADGNSPSARRCIWIIDGFNILIDSVNLTVDGYNSKCVEWGCAGCGIGTAYNILHRGGVYRNLCESYGDRQNYGGAVCMTDNFTSESGAYTVRMEGVTIVGNGHAGIVGKTGAFQIEACSLLIDSRNRQYDSLSCFANGSCGVGNSSANAYGILLRYAGAGSEIRDNVVLSGSQKYGSRGIMIDGVTNNSRSSDSILIAGNYVDVHEGPNGEDADGTTRVMRYRGREGAPDQDVKIIIRGNMFIGSADSDTGSNAIGVSAFPLDLTHGSSDSSDLVIEGNLFRARNLSNSGATAYCAYLGVSQGAQGSVTIRNNRWEGSQTIIRFNDEDNGIGTTNLALSGDTFLFIDTTLDPDVKIVSPRTFTLGFDNDNTTGNSVTDGVYLNQASDTNIIFAGTTSQATIALRRTLALFVRDANGDPVPDATVRVINNYGDTIYAGSSGLTGEANPVVTYWYEENNHSSVDSTSYNPFQIVAEFEGDADTSAFAVGWNSFADTLTLSGTSLGASLNGGVRKRVGRSQLRKVRL